MVKMKCHNPECDGTVTTKIEDMTTGRAIESCDVCCHTSFIPGNGQPVGGLRVERRDVSGAMWLAATIGFSIGISFVLVLLIMKAKGCF